MDTDVTVYSSIANIKCANMSNIINIIMQMLGLCYLLLQSYETSQATSHKVHLDFPLLLHEESKCEIVR